jgi:hypothetical protein
MDISKEEKPVLETGLVKVRKPGSGRKKKKEISLRNKRVTVMLTEEEKQLLQDKSKQAGFKVSIYMREISLGKEVKAKFTEAEWKEVKRLISMENNLNQLTKRLHITGDKLDEIEKVKNQLRTFLRELY